MKILVKNPLAGGADGHMLSSRLDEQHCRKGTMWNLLFLVIKFAGDIHH